MPSGFLQSHRKIVFSGSKKRRRGAKSARSLYAHVVQNAKTEVAALVFNILTTFVYYVERIRNIKE